MIFDFAAAQQENSEIQTHTVNIILYPKHWLSYSNTANLLWKKVKFSNSNTHEIPDDKAGIYSFVVDPCIAQHPSTNYLMYIGKVRDQSLRKRYKQYLRSEKDWKKRPHIAGMIRKWENHLYFYYAEVSDIQLINVLEDDLITAFLPPMNKRFPAEISLVMRAF